MNPTINKLQIKKQIEIAIKNSYKFLFLIIPVLITAALSILIVSCSNQRNGKEGIIIGIQSDVQTINPMYAFSVVEGNLIDLLFMKPAMEIWNDSLGIIEFAPMLAEKWEWNSDSSSITLKLRDDIYWSDGNPITSEDVVFSFDVYSDPLAESRFLGQFNKFNATDGLHIDINKTFEIISQQTVKIKFKGKSVPTLLDINLEIIPKHIWSKYSRKEITNAEVNFNPVTSGPFKLKKWEKESSISLIIDSSSFLYNPENINEIIFKIIPDYKSRITQLKTGEIDLIDNVKSEDASELKRSERLVIKSMRGRDYDYIGWNHINPDEKADDIPNKFFSSSQIRKALTYAINRKEILQSFLGEYGELAKGPVSPMFKTYFDNSIKLDEYNPEKARKILKENGWIDSDNDGILEKDNIEFKFDIYINAGNPRREFASTVVKNNLKAIGIIANIHSVEMGVFMDGLINRKFDAWIAGWTIPIPIDLNPYWNSDKEIGFLNFSSYKNNDVDDVFIKLQNKLTESEKIDLYKRIQNNFYNDEPVTFLYWFDNIIAYNNTFSEIKFSMLGLVKNAWEWKTN